MVNAFRTSISGKSFQKEMKRPLFITVSGGCFRVAEAFSGESNRMTLLQKACRGVKGGCFCGKTCWLLLENVRAFPKNFLDFPDGSERNGVFHGNAVAFVCGSVLENSCFKVSERCGYCLFRALGCLSTPSRKQKDAVFFFGKTKCYSSKTSLCVSPVKLSFRSKRRILNVPDVHSVKMSFRLLSYQRAYSSDNRFRTDVCQAAVVLPSAGFVAIDGAGAARQIQLDNVCFILSPSHKAGVWMCGSPY